MIFFFFFFFSERAPRARGGGGGAARLFFSFFSLFSRPRAGLATVESSFFRVGNQCAECEKQQTTTGVCSDSIIINNVVKHPLEPFGDDVVSCIRQVKKNMQSSLKKKASGQSWRAGRENNTQEPQAGSAGLL